MAHNGSLAGTGYSGTRAGRNNPAMQNVENVGPLPQGVWKIGPAHFDGDLGPCVMDLTPGAGTDTFGRSLFRIHGNNVADDASHGCIIMGPAVRQEIAKSGDTDLTVTP